MPFAKREKQITAILLIAFGVAIVVIATRQGNMNPGGYESPNLSAALSRPALGFDRNDYPGDPALPALRRTFAFSSYWLNNPLGATSNSWTGKRNILLQNDFGFLVLFNGRTSTELNSEAPPVSLGFSDANAAAKSATREGFARETIIFLDQEEGGRMLPAQREYIYAWVDGVHAAGFRAGIYCSAMTVMNEGAPVVTADDTRDHAQGRAIVFWVYNDACPPAPGCAYPANPPKPSASGFAQAEVWQFAQSPRRKKFTQRCAATYAADGRCNPPAESGAGGTFLDLDSANSADPSHGRS